MQLITYICPIFNSEQRERQERWCLQDRVCGCVDGASAVVLMVIVCMHSVMITSKMLHLKGMGICGRQTIVLLHSNKIELILCSPEKIAFHKVFYGEHKITITISRPLEENNSPQKPLTSSLCSASLLPVNSDFFHVPLFFFARCPV